MASSSDAGNAAAQLSYEEARARVLAAVIPLAAIEAPLTEALGRPLRRAVRAPHALPPFTNSSMDGFALRAADAAAAGSATPVELPVVEVVAAGRVASRPLAPGEAMRIMTGAALPAGADCIVPFEQAESRRSAGAECLRLAFAPAPGDHVRPAGADLEAGVEALPVGRELSDLDIGLLAALGAARVMIGPAPRAAIVSTGDELLAVDAPLRPGAIRDSNRLQLASSLEAAGCKVVSVTHAGDRASETIAAIQEALQHADVVLSIGGVSAGDFDPVKEGLAGLPDTALWGVAMKPGRPQAFGTPGGHLYFGLPGNPGSVACVFEALVRPALRKLQGFAALDRPRLAVRAAHAIASRAGRRDFVRVTLAWRDGAWWAREAGAQVSGHLTPQSRAHALLVVPEASGSLAAGEAAEALVLRWPQDGAG